MNYYEYITCIEDILNEMSIDQLKEWIMAKAVKQVESDRGKFISSLQIENKAKLPKVNWEVLHEWQDNVQSGACTICKMINEEYDDWYHDIDEEYFICDDSGIFKQIRSILDLAKEYAYDKDYQTALKLYDIVIKTEYIIEVEFDLSQYVSIFEFEDFDEIDIKTVFASYFFLNYMEYGIEAIPKIYPFLGRNKYNGKLEYGFSSDFGRVVDSVSIMYAWQAFLRDQEVDVSDWLYEALAFINDDDLMINVAQECVAFSPMLYQMVAVHLNEKGKYTVCDAFCQKGMSLLLKHYDVREKVMEEGKKATLALKNTEQYESYMYAIFLSSSTAQNFLKFYSCEHSEILIDKAYACVSNMQIIDDYFLKPCDDMISKKEYMKITFFYGDYTKLLDVLEKNKVFLGWTSGYITFLVHAFLALCGKGIMPNKLIMYLFDNCDVEDQELLNIWLDKHTIEGDMRVRCLHILMHQIEKRTDVIVDNTRRHSYHKVALLNIGLDYFLKDIGIEEGMQWRCRAKYPRRPALYREWDEMLEEFSK